MTTVFAHTTTGTLFGQRYADSAVVLAVLSAGFYFNAALGFNTYTLQVYGRLRWLLVVNFVAAGLNVALALLLIPAFGALGVAAANCATLVVQNVCNQIALRSTIGSAFVDRANVRPYLVILAATLVLTGFQMWLSPGFIAAIVLTGVVWLAVLFPTRRWLQLGETFPEMVRVPGVRLLVR
jgi:O-antigen/teichoic acid export membrane protein